jgi:PHD/YefM family antitoxin component YafN of YafNO toxin-antitoxin module
MRVTTADFIKHYGQLADQALIEPVTITKNGRDRLVVVSAAEYERLKRRDRHVFRPEDLSEPVLDLIASARSSMDGGVFDHEAEDWVP